MRFLLSLSLLSILGMAQMPPAFDVASLKPVQLTPGNYRANLGTAVHGEVTLTNATLSDCLKYAFEITNDSQISGLEWIRNKEVRFDILAKAPPETPVPQLRLMLQALLQERFGLVLHREPRVLPFLALVVGKKGPLFHDAQEGWEGAGKPSVPGRIFVHRMSVVATLLSRFMRQPVVDMTGLTGFYDVKLEWTPDQAMPAPGDGTQPREAPEPPAGPSIFTAVQEQLGLKLESRKGPLEVLVIDHAEMVPKGN